MSEFARHDLPHGAAPGLAGSAAPRTKSVRPAGADLATDRGLRRSGPRLIQAKLLVGNADDPAEREADAIAAEVLASLRSPFGGADDTRHPSATSGVATRLVSRIRRAPTIPNATRPVVGPEGGPLSDDVAAGVLHAGGGAALDSRIKPRLEGAFGTSFDSVRIHRESKIAPRLGARAFTYGSDVHFAPGEYRPASDEGMRVLSHELTHVVQQTGAVGSADARASRIARSSAKVQRDLGFEFETKQLFTRRSHGGALPAAGFPDALAATAAWGGGGVTRLPKGAPILTSADIEVQADDNGPHSDLEVVTTHFPETLAGRARLATAMTNLGLLVAAHAPFVAPAGGIVPAEALDTAGGFATQMHDAMLLGDWTAATTAPQVTMGVRLQNVTDLVRDLHGAPHETAPEKATRDPGRLRMRRPGGNPNEPRATTGTEETDTLILGASRAHAAIAAFQVIDHAAPGGPELEGFLTIVCTYIESVQHKQAFLKNHTPLMAKTNLATMWTTLPAPVQAYYGTTTKKGKTNFERLVECVPGYPAKMGKPVFRGVSHLDEDNKAAHKKQWYHKLTMRSWLRAIALRDTSKAEAAKQFFFGPKGSTSLRGVDQLTSASFPGKPANRDVEGYGALGANMDVDPTTGIGLPVFELRSPNRPISYVAAHQWALDLFDYVVSVNANPGGGYAHIV